MHKLLLRTFSAVHNGVYRLSGGRVAGKMGQAPVLLLTATGRKSGKKRTTPLLYGRDGDGLVVIASMGGAPTHPAWYHNLRGHPGAYVQVGRERRSVRARDAEGEERERLWARMVELYPQYAEYQGKTTRTIPVVVLEPA